MSKTDYVLDSWAVVAFLEDEPTAVQVEALIAEAQNTQSSLYITSVNLGEVWYSFARAYSKADADKAVDRVFGLGIEVVVADWALAHAAAVLKARGRVSYADCFAAALAKTRNIPVVTGDREFRSLAEAVKIVWLEAPPAED